jgi:hypothetical protein
MSEAVKLGLDPKTSVAAISTNAGEEGGGGEGEPGSPRAGAAAAAAAGSGGDSAGGGGITGMFSRLFGKSGGSGMTDHSLDSKMKVSDFDLLKVVIDTGCKVKARVKRHQLVIARPEEERGNMKGDDDDDGVDLTHTTHTHTSNTQTLSVCLSSFCLQPRTSTA